MQQEHHKCTRKPVHRTHSHFLVSGAKICPGGRRGAFSAVTVSAGREIFSGPHAHLKTAHPCVALFALHRLHDIRSVCLSGCLRALRALAPRGGWIGRPLFEVMPAALPVASSTSCVV